MRFFIQYYFWLAVMLTIVRSVVISATAYPRKSVHSLGSDIVDLIIGVVGVLWAAFLLWGQS